MDDVQTLPDDLACWVGESAGGALVAARRVAGGGRNQAWFVDVATDDGVRQLFLRWDPTAVTERGDPWTIHREATVYWALRDTDLPVARLIAVHSSRQAMLLTRLSGNTWFSQLRDSAEREAIASEFIGHLAALHRLDPRKLGLLEPDATVSAVDLAHEQISEIENVIEFRGGTVEPVLRLALDWLVDNVPAFDGPIVLVQGDTGPGNFMYENGRVSGITDFELAHLGDPMDDLAWVSLRSTQEPFTDLCTRFAEYQTKSGHVIDKDRIRYYRVMAEAKILVMSHGYSPADRGDGGGGDPGARLIFHQLHRRLCAEALADVMGVTLDRAVPLPPVEPSDVDAIFNVVLDQLRDVISPQVKDSFAQQRIKGLARALKYLAAHSRYRDVLESAELDDLRDTLAMPGLDLDSVRAAFVASVQSRRLDPALALRTVYREFLRRNELLRSASGALADRHYDPLTAL